jgi:aminoglycoside 6'-N-acetyltransferase I
MRTDAMLRTTSAISKVGMWPRAIESGIGRKLLRAAEEWARQQGCIEMASDALLENELSQRVHEALGFEEVDRCVRYRRTL